MALANRVAGQFSPLRRPTARAQREELTMSVQQLVVGVSDAASWADAHPDNPAAARRVSLRETCHLLSVLGLLLFVTLGLLTSTALVDAALRVVAGVR
jgi:hypothetical protein